MRREVSVSVSCSAALCMAVLGVIASSALAIAQQKTAKACMEAWQVDRTAKHARGITKTAYVARCRDGGAPSRPAAAAATPAAPAAGSGNAAGDRQAYTSIKELMESIIDPSADALWGSVGTVVDKEGIHEALPKTQEEWLDVRRAAVRLVEGSNLLMMPGREAAPAGTKSEVAGVELEPAEITVLMKTKRKSFDAFAKTLQVLSLESLRAVDAKDGVLLLDIGARIEDVCESCHQTFWYPPAKPASTRN
jgi:hypothetical protein